MDIPTVPVRGTRYRIDVLDGLPNVATCGAYPVGPSLAMSHRPSKLVEHQMLLGLVGPTKWSYLVKALSGLVVNLMQKLDVGVDGLVALRWRRIRGARL